MLVTTASSLAMPGQQPELTPAGTVEQIPAKADATSATETADKTQPPPPFRPMTPPSLPFVVALIGAVALLIVAYLAGPALFLFAIGTAIVFLLRPIVDRMEHRGVNRIVGSLVVVVIVVSILLVVLLGGLAILITQGAEFLKSLPTLAAELGAWYATVDLPAWLREAIDALVESLSVAAADLDAGTIILGLLAGSLGALAGLFGLFVLPFFMFYLLVDQPKMARSFFDWLPDQWRTDVNEIVAIIVRDIGLYVRAELIVGSLMFTMVTIGMFIIGLIVGGPIGSMALLLGAIAFVMELLPQIGPILSYIPALLLALITSPEAVVLVSIFYFVVFIIEGQILVPMFEGRMISFSGATVLVLIAIGFALGGILGAILALPVASVTRDVFGYLFRRARELGQLPPEPAVS